MDDPKSKLATAFKLQQYAATLGFDWPDATGVWDKLAEELGELKMAADAESQQHELGDVLFSLVNLARRLDIDPDLALSEANARFRRRFSHVEQRLSETADGRATLDDMELWWQEAKRLESDG